MDSAIKAVIIYLGLWFFVRLTGRRSLGQLTAFEFVLFLIIGGATQRALLGEDYSLTNAIIVIATLVGMDILLSLLERDVPLLRKVLTGMPMILVENGRPLPWRIRRARLTEDEIMAAARVRHGLEGMMQVKFAILEANGEISIIPQSPHETRMKAPSSEERQDSRKRSSRPGQARP
jgi:uncharacterized membrane protein YcaP (DUF421 family)